MGYAPDSTVAGYLGPTTENLDGDQWDDFLHDVVAGITGFDGTLVRPRWQPQPPTTPKLDVDWCAFGVMNVQADFEPWLNHYQAPDPGTDLMQRMERQSVMVSFYGPNAQQNAGVLRDGIYVDQNRAAFRANGVGIIEVSDLVRASELFRQQWRQRSDVTLYLKREVRRVYQVRNLVRAMGPITGNRFGRGTITEYYDTAGLAPPPPAVGVTTTVWDDGPDGPTVWDYGETEWR